MKKIIFPLFLLLIGTVVNAQGILFEKGTFDQALKKAKRENKCVFIDVFAVWCGPCRHMSNTVFKEKEIGDYANKHFVSMQIDCERGEGYSIRKRYAVEGLPGFLFLDPDGNVVYRSSGSMPSERFMGEMQKAVEYAKDPANMGRLAARYESEKNDETFVRMYLDKLKASKSAGYYDVVENYLKIQTTMADTSKAMVDFLYEHINTLVYGGEADRIITENFGTENWDKYVRKDIRKAFQQLPRDMCDHTLEYAVQRRDSSLIDLSIKRAKENGMSLPAEQKELLLTYFYQQTNQGEKYKQLAIPQIDSIYNSMNVEELKAGHQKVLQEMKKKPDVRMRSYASKYSAILRYRASDFSEFVTSPADKELMLKWAYRVYDLVPTDVDNVAFYAKVLYLYGDKNEGLRLMNEAIQLGRDTKNSEGLVKDYELMKAGKQIIL